jgi:hypothetical protein
MSSDGMMQSFMKAGSGIQVRVIIGLLLLQFERL